MTNKKVVVIKLADLLAVCLILASLFPGPATASSIPESAYISGVVGHAQTYTLSCEARSAVDWAAFWGVDISESDFLKGIPGSDNPDRGFVGNFNDAWGLTPPHSYGVHARPVAVRLKEYGLKAEAHRGLEWDDLRSEIAAGRPVIVWIIGQMWNGTPLIYTSSDGKKTTVARFEHTMILIGYDASQVHLVDAYSGSTQTYPLNTFLTSWSVLGNMVILGQGNPAAVQPPESGWEEKYTVQGGDYLTALAQRFDTTWQKLVALNDIPYPYTIYTGQVLMLPGSAKAPSKKPGTTKTSPKPTGTPKTTLAAQPPTLASPLEPLNLSNKKYLPLVLVSKEAEKPAKTTTSAHVKKKPPSTYIVQRGDFLIDLADRLGIDWHTLADLNNINYPWVIYPGQELKLP
jgi:LysM repeat protein